MMRVNSRMVIKWVVTNESELIEIRRFYRVSLSSSVLSAAVSFHSFNLFCLALKLLHIGSIYTRDVLSLQQSHKTMICLYNKLTHVLGVDVLRVKASFQTVRH